MYQTWTYILKFDLFRSGLPRCVLDLKSTPHTSHHSSITQTIAHHLLVPFLLVQQFQLEGVLYPMETCTTLPLVVAVGLEWAEGEQWLYVHSYPFHGMQHLFTWRCVHELQSTLTSPVCFFLYLFSSSSLSQPSKTWHRDDHSELRSNSIERM